MGFAVPRIRSLAAAEVNRQSEVTLPAPKRILKTLHDREDLIHKCVGWMLREIANRDGDAARAFLGQYYRQMPRTMLRYAIEKFPERERRAYLRGLK
jgi:3-methyladenine DNA glycosylase AlkD